VTKFRLTTIFILLAVWATACQKTEPANSNANTNTANTSVATSSATPAASSSQPAASPEVALPGTISMATPTDTYKTAYAARKNKDLATLKRCFAKDALAFLKDMAGIEKKTLDDQLKELMEKPQAATPDTRSEKINGNRATLEYLDEEGKWSTMDFSKEGNDWKIDIPKAN
jgi:DNA uptake protein ComE-like DNA-binding protein